MLTRTVRIPRFFYVNKGSITKINEILDLEKVESERTVIVSGRNFTKSVGDLVQRSIEGDSSRVDVENNGIQSIREVENAIKIFEPSLVIGTGGGKVLDITKFCAYKLNKPFLALPTVLSNDGISSPVSVVQTEHGVSSIGTNPPIGIIVDIDIINKSPKSTILAGIGDLISNFSAIEDWNLASKHVGEKIDKFAEILSRNSAEGFMQYLIRNGSSLLDEHTLISLAEGLIQSGIAMSLAGSSRPCSGSEHLISHALDKLLNHAKPHGLQVGLATLFTHALRKRDISDLTALYRRIDFPDTPEDLGIQMSTFMDAIRNAPATRKDRFTILNLVSDKEIKEAIKIAYRR